MAFGEVGERFGERRREIFGGGRSRSTTRFVNFGERSRLARCSRELHVGFFE